MNVTARSWKAEYCESGGYDCMTDAVEIKNGQGKTVVVIDLGLCGQSNCGVVTVAMRKNAGGIADIIVKAVNNHDSLLDACKKALTCQASMNSSVVEVLRTAIDNAKRVQG